MTDIRVELGITDSFEIFDGIINVFVSKVISHLSNVILRLTRWDGCDCSSSLLYDVDSQNLAHSHEKTSVWTV